MSPVAVGLDILLIVLLVTALTVGLRLNKRLKALRDGQAGFVKAVAELDGAAVRAEAGLKALRAASEDAHDVLLTRIETARALAAKLEGAALDIERRRAVAETASLPAQAPAAPAAVSLSPVAQALARAEARLDPRFREADRLPERRAGGVRGVDEDLFEDERLAEPLLRAGGARR